MTQAIAIAVSITSSKCHRWFHHQHRTSPKSDMVFCFARVGPEQSQGITSAYAAATVPSFNTVCRRRGNLAQGSCAFSKCRLASRSAKGQLERGCEQSCAARCNSTVTAHLMLGGDYCVPGPGPIVPSSSTFGRLSATARLPRKALLSGMLCTTNIRP